MPCKVHLQMEMTGPVMAGLYCVIVDGSEYLPSFSLTVSNSFPASSLSAVSQSDKGLLGVRVSQRTSLRHT